MLKKRIIPILQIINDKLVKSLRYKNPSYIGDPINAVKIFNEKKVDEIIIIDINRSKKKSDLNYSIIKDLADECRMPFAYGGGISSISQVEKLFSIGVEKIILNSSVLHKYELINSLSKNYGSQSVVVAVDINKNFFKKNKLFDWLNKKNLKKNIDTHIKNCVNSGAGEIMINCVQNEGTQKGFDFTIINDLNFDLSVPIIVNGGINSNDEIKKILKINTIDAVAVGAKFIYYGPHNAVLISYIEEHERENI